MLEWIGKSKNKQKYIYTLDTDDTAFVIVLKIKEKRAANPETLDPTEGID